jgi:hypothetical protein
MPQPTLEILAEDEGFLFGKLDNLGLIIWRGHTTPARIARIVEAFARFEDEHGFGLLSIIGPRVNPPGPEARNAFDQAMRAHRDRLLGIATVIHTQGVFGGLSRAIARTLSIISRTPYPHNVYATLEEASRWIPSILARPPLPELEPSTILEAIAAHYPNPSAR